MILFLDWHGNESLVFDLKLEFSFIFLIILGRMRKSSDRIQISTAAFFELGIFFIRICNIPHFATLYQCRKLGNFIFI